jgi:hypothetical protein
MCGRFLQQPKRGLHGFERTYGAREALGAKLLSELTLIGSHIDQQVDRVSRKQPLDKLGVPHIDGSQFVSNAPQTALYGQLQDPESS